LVTIVFATKIFVTIYIRSLIQSQKVLATDFCYLATEFGDR